MNKKNLAILIAVIVVIIGIIVLAVISTENGKRKEMYQGIDKWVNGEEAHWRVGTLIKEYGNDDEELAEYLRDATLRCKDDAKKLYDFTKTLKEETLTHFDAVQEAVDEIWNNMPLDEKLENSEKWHYNRYMDDWKVTYQDVEKYIEENGKKQLHRKSDTSP